MKNFERLKNMSVASNKLLEEVHPRVISKISLCTKPMKGIEESASIITGLSNLDLANLSQFDGSTIAIINHFLGQFVKPLCLVAHNGTKYDLPILKGHLQVGHQLYSIYGLSPEIFCQKFAKNSSCHSYETRNMDDLVYEYRNSQRGSFGHRFAGPEVRNSLPMSIRLSENVSQFKSRLKNHFLGRD
ncbi:uncharacterized protein LOC136024826 isoform X2 [Artemia franciscana]|uniref:uncharacterized protein LOC136024826 isoform X2 n=1 Tax=Artemia franciscana TaxID=6661 RepID=UPI0032DBCD55